MCSIGALNRHASLVMHESVCNHHHHYHPYHSRRESNGNPLVYRTPNRHVFQERVETRHPDVGFIFQAAVQLELK